MADFALWKQQRLSRADGSRKGSVDEPIAGIVRLLNDRDCFCTTSSCSGRVVVLEQPPLAPSTEVRAWLEPIGVSVAAAPVPVRMPDYFSASRSNS